MNFFVVSVNPFNGGSKGAARPDVNGLMPVILKAHNVQKEEDFPERARVLSGTVAKNAGIETRHIYLIQVDETGTSEYGPTFRHQVIGELTAIEFATNLAQMPLGKVNKVGSTSNNEVDAEVEEKKSKF